MPSDFDPDMTERYVVSCDVNGHKIEELSPTSMLRASDYDSLLSIYRSQQERIGKLEDVVRAFACVHGVILAMLDHPRTTPYAKIFAEMETILRQYEPTEKS